MCSLDATGQAVNFFKNIVLWENEKGATSTAVAVTKISSGVLIAVGVAAAAIAILALSGVFPALGIIFATGLGVVAIGAVAGAGCIGGLLLLVHTVVHSWHGPANPTSSLEEQEEVEGEEVVGNDSNENDKDNSSKKSVILSPTFRSTSPSPSTFAPHSPVSLVSSGGSSNSNKSEEQGGNGSSDN